MKNLNQIFEEVLNEVSFNKDNTANSDFNLREDVLLQRRIEFRKKLESYIMGNELGKLLDAKDPFYIAFINAIVPSRITV